MAVNNRNSTQIANRDAVPLVLSNPSYARARIKESYGYVTATNADSATSVYRLCQIPSNARISSIVLACAALGSGAVIDVGAYYGNDAKSIAGTPFNGAVISANFFATLVDVSSALAPVSITNESGTFTLDKQEQPIWQALGLATDPECHLDICATVSVAIAATGLLALRTSYSE